MIWSISGFLLLDIASLLRSFLLIVHWDRSSGFGGILLGNRKLHLPGWLCNQGTALSSLYLSWSSTCLISGRYRKPFLQWVAMSSSPCPLLLYQPCLRCFLAFFSIWNSMFRFILASEFSMTGIGGLLIPMSLLIAFFIETIGWD